MKNLSTSFQIAIGRKGNKKERLKSLNIQQKKWDIMCKRGMHGIVNNMGINIVFLSKVHKYI